MGQARPKARPKKSGEGPCAADGPPPPSRSWQAPPDGLFDVIVPTLTTKQFVVVQLVCKDWSRSARYCLKDATPKRPDVDLSKLVTLYPNLTQLNLSHVEGLSTRMLIPLRRLTALRELCLSNVALQHGAPVAPAIGDEPPGPLAPSAAAPAAGVPLPADAVGRVPLDQLHSPSQPQTRARSRAAATGVRSARPAAQDSPQQRPSNATAATTGATSPPVKAPGAAAAGVARPVVATAPSDAGGSTATVAAGCVRAGSATTADFPPSPQHRHKAARLGPHNRSPGDYPGREAPAGPVQAEAAAGAAAGTVEGMEATGSGPLEAVGGPPTPSSPPLPPACRIFGGLGDVLLRLSKLQADLCPALTAESLSCLPNLTDLTVDTLVAPEALAPLARLRSLAVKKLANPEAIDRLSGLTALLVNSDSSCASEFLPVCTRLPELQSLTFKTSSTRVLQQPDLLCWSGFSRLSSLDLRAPVEVLKPGLPALAELRALRSLSLDLYCASDEELMVAVVAPPNLESLFVSSDRSRSGGVIDVHPNPRLKSLRIRLYWTALNLVLPEGLPEPSPMPEPLSEDLEVDPMQGPGPAQQRPLLDRLNAHAAHPERRTPPEAGAAAAGTTAVEPVTTGTADERTRMRTAVGSDGGRHGRRGGSHHRHRPRPSGASPAATDAGGATSPDGLTGGGGPSSGRRRVPTPAAAERTSSGGDGGSGADGTAGEDRGEACTARGALTATVGTTAGAAGHELGRLGTPATATEATGETGADEEVGGGMGGLSSEGGKGGDGSATDTEEREDADSGGRRNVRTPASAGGLPRQELHCSKGRARGSAPPPAAAGAGSAPAFETPVLDPRGSGGVATPAASAGVGGCCSAGGRTGGCGAGVAVPEMELQDLCLDACFFLLYGSLVPVLRQFPRLKSLTLDNCLALENGELGQLCELSGLREVSLSGLHLVTDSGLRALGRLPRLASLRVRGLRKMAVHACQAYMRQKPIVRKYEDVSGSFLTSLSSLPELRSLALKHLHTAGEGALVAGLGALKQLSKLEIKDVQSMSDTVLLALTRHTGLQELAVMHCEAVTARGRNAVVSALGQRVSLDFEGCSLPDITRPCALPTTSTQAQLIGDDQASGSNREPRRSCQHSNQH